MASADFFDPTHTFFRLGGIFFFSQIAKLLVLLVETCKEVVFFDIFATKRGGTLHLTEAVGSLWVEVRVSLEVTVNVAKRGQVWGNINFN